MPLSLSVVPVIIIVIITTIQTTYVIKGGGQKVPIKAFSYLPSDNSTAQCVNVGFLIIFKATKLTLWDG